VQLEHSFTVPVGIDEAWDVLLDIERVAPCMPGAAIDSVDGDDFTGTVKVKLGPIGLTYKGKASFIEKDLAAHRAVINAQGRDARGAGTAAARVTATLTSEGAASTKVLVTTDLDITGKPAQFGRGVMVDVGNKLIGQFADCLAGQLTAGNPAPAESSQQPASDSAPTVETPTTVAKKAAKKAPAKKAPAKKVAAAPAASGTTSAQVNGTAPAAESAAAMPAAEPGTDESAAATTAPVAVPAAPAAAPAASPAPRPQPAREVEPIDLMQSAGPAVAKRLAPVVGGLVFLLIVLRLLRRRSS
jgi:carbon monoxide dehydrogenase subunit G